MPYVPPDEILVEQLSEIGTVYHLEVYQKDQGNPESYPCIVYWRSGFKPYIELAGQADIATFYFTVMALAMDSTDLRHLADSILLTYEYEYLLAVQEKYWYVNDWSILDEDEAIEFASELQFKGIKYSAVRLSITMATKDPGEEFQCP